jgi:methionyl-tRNA synthetase
VVGQPKGTGFLKSPRCKLDGTTPEPRTTKHLYLRLDLLEDDVKKWFTSSSEQWSSNCIAITQAWLAKGLEGRSITRDLKWGVPSKCHPPHLCAHLYERLYANITCHTVPKGLKGLSDEEYKDKVFYVWFDACVRLILRVLLQETSINELAIDWIPINYESIY